MSWDESYFRHITCYTLPTHIKTFHKLHYYWHIYKDRDELTMLSNLSLIQNGLVCFDQCSTRVRLEFGVFFNFKKHNRLSPHFELFQGPWILLQHTCFNSLLGISTDQDFYRCTFNILNNVFSFAVRAFGRFSIRTYKDASWRKKGQFQNEWN